MAKRQYLKIPKTNIYRPYIGIWLSNPRTEKKTPLIRGLIDSGADICTAPKELALWLGITFDEQDDLAHIVTADGSISNAVKKVVIISLEKDRYECPFLFVEGIPPDQPILLGQEGFFDHFKICFDRQQKAFEIF